MKSNVKRGVVSLALIMAAGSARAGEVRSTAAVAGHEPRYVASASIQPERPVYDCDAVGNGEPSRAARDGKDDGRSSEVAAIEDMNHERFLREVWRSSP